MSESEVEALMEIRLNHAVDLMAKHFSDNKPTVADFKALPDSELDTPIDGALLNKAWKQYQGLKMDAPVYSDKGGAFVKKGGELVADGHTTKPADGLPKLDATDD